ncbi:MAG: TRAP transporter small permease [Lachnospiraceae bacterium]|nr:TRAP transporter small permease [Lachnospiraceae bacterium]
MKVLLWIEKHLEEYLMALLLVIIAVVMILQVIMRYVFNSPLYWAEEFCRYGLVWSTFISIGYCTRYHLMLHVDLLERVFPKVVRVIVQIVIKLVTLAFYLILFRASFGYIANSIGSGQTSAAIGLPIYLLEGITIPGLAMGVIRAIQDLVLYLISLKGGSRT